MPQRNRGTSNDSDSDYDRAPEQKQIKTINDVLVRALAEAANPGIGDEEPEVLEAPPTQHDPNKIVEENMPTVVERKLDDSSNSEQYSQPMETKESMPTIEEAFNEIEHGSSLYERAKYIPLRLSYEERKTLRLVNAAIDVSDYTNVIDVSFKNSARRRHTQLQQIVAFLTGIISATSYDKGQEVLAGRNFKPYEKFIKSNLEIARRYKITNPEKMRSEYGKMVYLMQDAVSESIEPLLGLNIHKPVQTVYSILDACGGTDVLKDPSLPTATGEILPDRNKSRSMIQQEIKRKERAAENIVRKYASARLNPETIRLCMYSISDNNSFLNSNRRPVVDCIELLEQYFAPDICDEDYSLAINEGTSGARLSHSHELQYRYVHQSLTLWSAILKDMFRLWSLAEQDLLDRNQPYELRNTGQGLQRVQQSPRVFKAMHEILGHTQMNYEPSSRLTAINNNFDNNRDRSKPNGGSQNSMNWVGTSVIHLGDHNVPNALVFIDKYTQVSRILSPLITTLRNLETACEESEGLARYLESYGGIEKAKKDILHDFFTHGFDGSGGDNFFDAGSCIDGRLTSAWNWCSQLSTKPYYPLFRLTGFLSFDGEFDA